MPEYLKTDYPKGNEVIDYLDWQIPPGRSGVIIYRNYFLT